MMVTLASLCVGGGRRCARLSASCKVKARLELSQGEAPVAARARAHRARLAQAGAVLRVRRGRVLPLRRRAARDRGAAPRRASCGSRRCTASASPRRGGSTARGRGRHLRPAVHRRLPRAVPVQPLRAPAPAARRVRPRRRRACTVTDLDGNALLRPDRLVRRQRASATTSTRSASTAAAERVRDARPGARRLPPGGRRQRAAAARDLRARRGVVPHVGHRGGDAGGAARALPHAALAPGALLRRLPRLVGRRAAGRRQPDRRRARPTRSRTWTRTRCACCARATRHRLRAGEPAAGAAPERQRAERLDAGRQRRAARTSTAPPTPTG